MKDFYDIYELSRSCDFDGASLAEAIKQTFKHRDTNFLPCPMVFTDEFPLLLNKQEQWQGFLRRTDIANVPSDFPVIIAVIKKFLLPVYKALVNKESFYNRWENRTEMWHKSVEPL
jgi:hypothetical protein